MGADRGSGSRDEPTVLFVDDVEALRDLAREVLPAAGFRVLLAADGVDAIEVFRASADRIDVVVLDLTLPHLDGLEVCQRIHQLRPEVPVVFASGFPGTGVHGKAEPGRFAGFLRKPYRAAELIQMVRMALDGGASSELEG